MEAIMLNASFEVVRIIDAFDNFIWTDRYSSYGDFELYMPLTEENIRDLLDENDGYRYVAMRDSNHIMIVEDVQIDSNVEDGAQLCVAGRSLESILEQRVIYDQITVSGDFQDGIHKILNETIISPSDNNRKIDIFDFKTSSDTTITSLELDVQIARGSYVYDVIKELCESKNIGFRITLSEDTRLKFELYSGVDRSYEQDTNSYVVFSPAFDNLLSSNYLKSKKNLKTVALVLGEGEGAERASTSVESSTGGGTGLDRREMSVDARDISRNVEGGTLSDAEYDAHLTERGVSKLTECSAIESFEGEVDPSLTFKYGTPEDILTAEADYSMGDVVQIENEYGIRSRSRVTEVVRSESSSGFEMYPTFTKIK